MPRVSVNDFQRISDMDHEPKAQCGLSPDMMATICSVGRQDGPPRTVPLLVAKISQPARCCVSM
jgi:hypothetical protein